MKAFDSGTPLKRIFNANTLLPLTDDDDQCFFSVTLNEIEMNTQRPNCEHRKTFVWLWPWLALFFSTGSLVFATNAVWCAKPLGLLERNHTFELDDTQRGIRLAQSLSASGTTFLYLRRTPVESQTYAAVGGMIYGIQRATNPSASKLTVDEIDAELKKPALQQGLSELTTAAKNARTEPNWYFYSNAPVFKQYIHEHLQLDLQSPDKGALLLMDDSGAQAAWLRIVTDLVSYLKPTLILLQGEEPPVSFDLPKSLANRPLVIRLRGVNDSISHDVTLGMDAISELSTADAKTTSIIFLMPETKNETRDWHFSDEKAERFVTNGSRILQDLHQYGFTASVTKAKSRDNALAAIKDARSSKRLVVLVGEAGDHNDIRVPGSSGTIGSDDLATVVGSSALLGLVCDSNSFATSRSLSVIGKISTDRIRGITRVLFDKRQPDSTDEYLDVPISTTVVKAARSLDSLGIIAARMRGSSAEMANAPALFVVTGSAPSAPTSAPIQSSAPATQTGSLPPMPAPDPTPRPPWQLLFLSGVIGALAREVQRWRRLTNRRRADKFRKMKYFIISLVQISIGGSLAVIFAQFADAPWCYPIGFVAGAGQEELLRRAMMLKIWTPSVDHGPEAEPDPDSALEYFRT